MTFVFRLPIFKLKMRGKVETISFRLFKRLLKFAYEFADDIKRTLFSAVYSYRNGVFIENNWFSAYTSVTSCCVPFSYFSWNFLHFSDSGNWCTSISEKVFGKLLQNSLKNNLLPCKISATQNSSHTQSLFSFKWSFL